MTVARSGIGRVVTQALILVLLATGLEVVAAPSATAARLPRPVDDLPSVDVSTVGLEDAERPTDEADEDAVFGEAASDGVAAAAEAPAGAGKPTATSLSGSGSWSAGGSSGGFGWSYPLRVPPVLGGLTPTLSLGYSSQSVDGRTSATNNQTSWVGEGWDLSPGFIERTYRPCADDTQGSRPPATSGDLCWANDNASLSLSGAGGQLIADGQGRWHSENDNNARIERVTGAGNGDDDGESWKVTTTDGTQYFFGSRPASKSTWTVPVYGDDPGEPCHQGSFATSACVQAWRWNLDYVVDRHGNAAAYFYEAETNLYGQNDNQAAASYVRGGYPIRVEYGLRDGSSARAVAQVRFDVADRCVPGAACDPAQPAQWPDVPWSEQCRAAPCGDRQVSPTFWTTKRLARITTQIADAPGSGFRDVDSWTLEHTMPDPGDGTKAVLWLKGITHAGHVGGDATLPPVRFEGVKLPNRVYAMTGHAPLLRYRLSSIVSETGAVTTITYAEADCTKDDLPAAPERNDRRCFPVWWTPPGAPARQDWFHKYVVDTVVDIDTTGDSPAQVTTYSYLDGAGWHYDQGELTPADKRTWSDWRGYGRVRVTKGADNPAENIRTQSETRYFRGMHGDTLPGGATRTALVSDLDPETPDVEDLPQYAGMIREQVTLDGVDGAVSTGVVNDPWSHGPTAVRGDLKAYVTRIGATQTRTALASGGWRRTTTRTTYEPATGNVVAVDNAGDTAVAGDETCSRSEYVTNPERWLLTVVSRTSMVAVACGADPAPADLLNDTRTSYDGQEWGVAPSVGNATLVQQARDRAAVYPGDFATVSATTYDEVGRAVSITDAADRTATTTYTPALGGPVTQVVTTNPLGHKATSLLEPAWGVAVTEVDANGRRTDHAFDPLGRVAEVWTPGFFREDGDNANLRFTYHVRNDGPVVVASESIGPNHNRVTSYALHDSRLRLRQAQSPAAGGGRVVTETRYDSQGRAFTTTAPYYNEDDPGTELVTAADADIPGLTVTAYDGAGRPVATVFKGGGYEKWRTTTRYDGDRTHVTPPPGGTATTVVADAHGRTTELHQYDPADPAVPPTITRYGYDRAGQLASVTDAAENQWGFEYDLRGRKTATHDPDKGSSSMTYNDVGELQAVTDGGGVTLGYEYDALGRKTRLGEGGATRVEWTYDTATLGVGLPASATRWYGDTPYRTDIRAYHLTGQVRQSEVVIPSVPGDEGLAGTYRTVTNYQPDGSLASTFVPAAGGLAAETVNHTYDDIGLAKTTTGSLSRQSIPYVSSSRYTRLGELAQRQVGSGSKRAWETFYYEDHTRRLARVVLDVETAQPMQADVNYAHDPAGNITRIADTPRDRPADVQCFDYDHLRQLTEAWTPEDDCEAAPSVEGLAGPAPYWQSFTYDAVGNRASEVQHAATGDVTRTYTYPAPGSPQAHTLSSVETSGPTGSSVDSYAYDAVGNTVERHVGQRDQVLTWDAEGRLDTAADASGTTAHVYDAAGSRLLRRDPTGTTLYLGAQELRLDKATGSVKATRYYSQGGATVAMRTPAGLTWMAADHQGTSQFSIDARTLDVVRRRQTPFGAPRGAAAGPAFPGERGFVGGTIDASTGLTQLGARPYDAAIGRFVSVDPLMDLADPLQMHGYAYANNSPVTKSDPTGLAPCRNGPDGTCWQEGVGVVDIGSSFDGERNMSSWDWFVLERRREPPPPPPPPQQRGWWGRRWDNAKSVGRGVANGAKEISGYNDAKDCFGDGDAIACVSILPWGKVVKVGRLAKKATEADEVVAAAPPAPSSPDDLLAQARANRDELGRRPDGSPDRSSAAYVGTYEERTGAVHAAGSRPGGIHAEDVADGLIPSGKKTEAMGWRRNRETGELEWTEIPVCTQCQPKYPPSQFPPGTQRDPGGAWERR